MIDVSQIGLGAMGSALARAFLGAGHSLCVWNRTAPDAYAILREKVSLAYIDGDADGPRSYVSMAHVVKGLVPR